MPEKRRRYQPSEKEKETCFPVGTRFGKLTTLEVCGPESSTDCLCDCGKTIRVKHFKLISKNTRACGDLSCTRNWIQEGQRSGLLTSLEKISVGKEKSVKCICDCGIEKTFKTQSFVYEEAVCCGGVNCLALYKNEKSNNSLGEKILKGTKFGKIMVLEDCLPLGNAKCICDCGKEFINSYTHIKDRSISCGKTCGLINPVKGYIGSFRKSANRNGYFCSLTDEEFESIIFQNCYYCDASPSKKYPRKNKKNYIAVNGIDRLNSNKGYIQNNVVPCCWICNFSKNTLTLLEFSFWIAQVYKNISSVVDNKWDAPSERLDLSPIENKAVSHFYQDLKNREQNFSVSKKDVADLMFRNCFYCNIKPSNALKIKLTKYSSVQVVNYSGLDRVDNNLGYLTNNVVPCCAVCNCSKRDLELYDWLDWVNRAYKGIVNQGIEIPQNISKPLRVKQPRKINDETPADSGSTRASLLAF